MASLGTEIQRSFRLYVTHVDGESHFLKICGQLDQPSCLMIESLFETARENLEKGVGAIHPAAIHEGIICAAKYKDGTYYRAKIISTANLATGQVGVHFIDFGNKDIISISSIRFLDNYDPLFLTLRPQATDYYLARVMHPSGRWEEPLLLKLQSLLCYSEYPASIEATTRTLPIISIQFKGNDLSSHLVANRFFIAISLAKQEVLLMQLSGENPQNTNWQPNYGNEPTYPEHVPFLINQNFPSNPASAMRLQQNIALPFNGTIPPPSLISQRLLVNKASRNPVNLKPSRQPQQMSQPPPQIPQTPPPAAVMANKPPSPKKSNTYKSRLLEVGSQHKVFVSFAEDGPELFAVQLVADGKRLQDMMDDINRRPHSSLAEPPMIGTVCLGRMSGDRIICRAIVMNLSGSQCKLFFVDFGDTEMVSYYDIFDIPEEFVKPNVFAMRFCLSGVKSLKKSPHLNEAFKQLVNEKVLTLRVVPPEGPPLIQYGELYLDNKNVLEILLANMNDNLQFKWMEMLPLGSKSSVLVSYVDSCLKFFVQLTEYIDELNEVMDAVKIHCESSVSPGDLPVGAACCARFPEDGNWYRARVLDKKNNKVTVAYVDYGNEQEIDVSDLRTITPNLIKLPAQAMKCALKGYESKPVETKTSNQLEMLALEKTLTAHIMGMLSTDTMLVTLINESVSPPMDVARRMTQLSQPRSNVESKATTPVRKEAPESFSSPEGSEDSRKKSFRREKSFKDERRPPPAADEFGQRGSSFRGRDKEPFDRSGSDRRSEKFARDSIRPDRGDRRGGPKPRDNPPPATSPVAATTAGDDEWEESSAPQPSYQPPQRSGPRDRDNNRDRDNRDNRDRDNRDNRRKPREQGPRPNWKGKDQSGVGKRLGQPTEAASLDSQGQTNKGFSVQDRLKRDRFNQNNGEERRNDWGNKGGRSDRPDWRDNRGDRRDNRGDKDNFQKREYRDNNRERGDRSKSNFTPRDRAERSFGSDGDKKSEKGFRSDEGAGRAPPYKSRSKFTQVQYKELPDPISLESAFQEPVIENGAQHEVSVTWIISPESFYTQIMSQQQKFVDMMHIIPELYKGVKSYTGIVPVGASVLARYPADGVLYRAQVVSVQPFSKFVVQYVDFGNKQLVDAKDIWQLDRQLMELPKMAVHCSLLGVGPKEGEWKASADIDLCFNAPRYQCVFQDCVEGRWTVSLWNNGVSVADTLVEKDLAVKADHKSVALKDEAIDLTIIVGQQILCKVTHVESYNKFYVQLDLDKAALVESAIANFDAAKLTPLAPESLTEGVHCTVKHEGKIYRAILEDTADPQNVRAVLPDYGMKITTAKDNLMILPTELSVYYYQSLECSLNNYTADSNALMSVQQMQERLLNNKFIIYINYVEEITLVSTLYDVETGKKIAIFEPDEGAYDEVVQLCARAVFNYNFGMAYVVHGESLNEIYMQKAADSDKIALLLDDLYKFYEEGTPEALTSFEVAGLCAAKSSDGNWYRATILSVEENDVKVQFSDYGNSETIAKDAIKKLDPQFYEPCALALVAGLGLVALQDDALPKLIEWTTEKEVQVTLAFGSDGWLANLHLDGVDLSMKLISETLAKPSTEEQKEAAPTEESVSLPPGCTQVYISHIDTPGHFWLQMSDKVDAIEEIQAELQRDAANYPDVENREMGTLCVAKYLADEQWYRAEILDADSDITTVRFTDYGNTDVLDNQPGLLKAIPAHLRDIDRYALKSSVNAVPTGTGEWSEAASAYFTQLVGDLSAPVDALIVLKDVTTYVDIFVNGQNLTDKLVSEGHATKSDETECGGDLPSCFASHINSPSEFWIQLESATPELQAMENAMVDAENFPELTEKEEGVICAAKYPEDGAWYRAQVIVDGSEGTEVLFMDYGNASIANELRSLPDELKGKPALSRKCALQKPRDIKSWSRKSEIKFNELAAEGATIFNVQFIASGDISIVELYLESKSVTEELVGLCEEQPSSERPTPVGQDLRSSGKICYVNSADDFYVQLDDNAANIDKIFDGLSGAADFEPALELKVGSLCAAFWDEDEQWYRAKVLEFCDGGYHVLFVDYGNKSKCQEFRQLPEDLAALEPAAKCCRLAGLGESASVKEAAKAKLDELAADDASTFQIEFLDSTKEPTLVKLFLSGQDVALMISSETPETVSKPDTETLDETKPPTITESASFASEISATIPDSTTIASEITETIVDSATFASELSETNTVSVSTTELKTDTKDETTDVSNLTPKDTTEVAKSNLTSEDITEVGNDSKAAGDSEIEVKDLKSGDSETITDSVSNTELNTDTKDETATEISNLTPDYPTFASELNETNTVSVSTTKLNMDNKDETTDVSNLTPDTTEVAKSNLTTEDTKKAAKESKETSGDSEFQVKTPVEDTLTEIKPAETDDFEEADNYESAEELNTSQPDLNESVESSNTVIENKSFDTEILEDAKDNTPTSAKDLSSETFESSNDTVKTSDRDDSKDSLNTDTGYTSDHDKLSPIKDEETGGKEDSPKKEISENTSDSPKKAISSEIDKVDSPIKEQSSEISSNVNKTLE